MTEKDRIKVYQAKCTEFLPWSQPFIYRLLTCLESYVDEVVLTQRVCNRRLFPMPRVEKLNIKTLLSPASAHLAARRLQATHHAHVLHAHFGYSAAKMLLLKLMMRIPMVVTFGGKDLTVHASRPNARIVYNCLFQTAEQLVAVSDDLRDQAIELGCPPEKITTVRRGVDIKEFDFIDRSERSNNPVNILMVSRLVKKKGHSYAVEALANLPAGLPDWRLTILGEGPEEDQLARKLNDLKIRNKVHFLGSVSIDRVREQMAKADIMLHPSVTSEDGDMEGLPNAILEAFATGLPVIATRHGGIPEAVRDRETGLLVPERDVEALKNALARLVGSREERISLGRAACDFVKREFMLQSQAEKYLAIYERLAEKYPPDHPSYDRTDIKGDLPTMLRKAHAEAGIAEDLSISEMFEYRFISEKSGHESEEPWWYTAFWNLKKYVPRKMKFRIKGLLYKRFGSRFEEVSDALATRDSREWKRVQEKGIPRLDGPSVGRKYFH